jgi:two-component system, OmpR family, response regulator TctD
MRVLVVEDTTDVGEGIVACIKRMGHAVDWVQDGTSADRHLTDTAYELAILDLMLPKMDGVCVLRRLRARRSSIPVLVLTARSAIDDRVSALDLGADDYLIKPFDFRELEARINSLMRRRTGERTNELLCGALMLDRSARMAHVNGAPLNLTRREISILEILMANQSRIFSKAALLDQIVGYGDDIEPHENAIEVIITRLRRKLVGAGAGIRTHRGLGYRISPE